MTTVYTVVIYCGTVHLIK